MKPQAIGRFLARLVCPPGGVVLDPFAGSGSLSIGAMLEGFRAIGIELNPEYAEVARRRLNWWATKATDADKAKTNPRAGGVNGNTHPMGSQANSVTWTGYHSGEQPVKHPTSGVTEQIPAEPVKHPEPEITKQIPATVVTVDFATPMLPGFDF